MPRAKKTEEQKAAAKEYKKLRAADDQKLRKKELYDAKEWYTIRAILGNQWANW